MNKWRKTGQRDNTFWPDGVVYVYHRDEDKHTLPASLVKQIQYDAAKQVCLAFVVWATVSVVLYAGMRAVWT